MTQDQLSAQSVLTPVKRVLELLISVLNALVEATANLIISINVLVYLATMMMEKIQFVSLVIKHAVLAQARLINAHHAPQTPTEYTILRQTCVLVMQAILILE
jgi:hypothetical protein